MGKSQNVRLLLEYDGSCFGGWQRVENGKKPSVQGTLEEVITESLSELSGKREAAVPEIQVIGSGRTDAGVHALGQVANVHLPLAIWRDRTPKEWRADWNRLLPEGVRIRLAEEVPQTFHSRYDAIGKTYCYVFDRREAPSAFAGRYAYWLGSGAERKDERADRKDRGESGKWKRGGEKGNRIREWNQEAVEAASQLLIGEHDFSAFSSKMEPGRGTVRTITRLEWKELERRGGEFLLLEVEGNGFLYHMVRILAGTLYEVGAGRRRPESVLAALESGRRQDAGVTLPGYGLFLKEVRYISF